MQHRRTTWVSLVALVLMTPACSMLSSLGNAVPGGAFLTQGLTAGASQLMAKRQQCKAQTDPAATAATTGVDPASPPPTMGGTVNAQAAAGFATAMLSKNMCSRAERRAAKRAAKRAARRGEPLPTQPVAPVSTPEVTPPADVPSVPVDGSDTAAPADGIVDPYAEVAPAS
ncbi:MAG: hypothetical protein K1X88_34665 [Nannocystaceae bacterium]|nr:hypothetical protein [Nannocystaceae bacterium]